MTKLFVRRSGEGTPLTIAIVLALLLLFNAVGEYARLWLIVQGVEEATQDAVISSANDNYDDVYHAVREGYAAGWQPDDDGWLESIDTGAIYEQLSETLGLDRAGSRYVKYAGDAEEYAISGLDVAVTNNALASGVSSGYNAEAQIRLEVPVRFLGSVIPKLDLTLHVEAEYVPLF